MIGQEEALGRGGGGEDRLPVQDGIWFLLWGVWSVSSSPSPPLSNGGKHPNLPGLLGGSQKRIQVRHLAHLASSFLPLLNESLLCFFKKTRKRKSKLPNPHAV